MGTKGSEACLPFVGAYRTPHGCLVGHMRLGQVSHRDEFHVVTLEPTYRWAICARIVGPIGAVTSIVLLPKGKMKDLPRGFNDDGVIPGHEMFIHAVERAMVP